jgi:hypothetical protein
MATKAVIGKDWWHHIRQHQYAIFLWLLLNLADSILTQVGLSQGGYEELNWFLRDLSLPAFALQKLLLTMAAVMWLAIWRWLWFVKWLNLLFVVVLCLNFYELIKLI